MRGIAVTGNRDRPNRTGRRGHPGRACGGFTLIELMVAIFIISILIALVIGVGKYVYDESARRETESMQAIAMNAVEAFYGIVGEYPPDSISTPPAEGLAALLYCLRGGDEGGIEDLKLPESTCIRIKEVCGQILLEIPSDYFDGTTIKDAWGKQMDYKADGGLGGKPVLISPGPDGDMNTEDDIRSDM